MSNIEHLIENALTAMSKKPNDTYQAFTEEMSGLYNRLMLQEVSVTKEELWEIAQYIVYTWIPNLDVEPVRHGRWVSLTECANAGVYCSVCNKKVYKEDYARCNKKNKLRSPRCPNCGAKMMEVDNG